MTNKPEWYFHEQTQEYQDCYRKHSPDGNSPEVDYHELIWTITDLYDRIKTLERRLDKQEEYEQEQTE